MLTIDSWRQRRKGRQVVLTTHPPKGHSEVYHVTVRHTTQRILIMPSLRLGDQECDELLWGGSNCGKPLEVITSRECFMHTWCVLLILTIQLVINAIRPREPTHTHYTPTFGGLCHGIAIDTRCHCSCNLRRRDTPIECVCVCFRGWVRQLGQWGWERQLGQWGSNKEREKRINKELEEGGSD